MAETSSNTAAWRSAWEDQALARLRVEEVPREVAEGLAAAFGRYVDAMADLADPQTRQAGDER